jgi:16S rRNA G966 N2-methylase RsmD
MRGNQQAIISIFKMKSTLVLCYNSASLIVFLDFQPGKHRGTHINCDPPYIVRKSLESVIQKLGEHAQFAFTGSSVLLNMARTDSIRWPVQKVLTHPEHYGQSRIDSRSK